MTQVDISTLEQNHTIRFECGLTALVCHVIHAPFNSHAHIGEYIVYFFVNETLQWDVKHYRVNGTRGQFSKNQQVEWTPAVSSEWFITEIIKRG
jgi:hypothetical protein